MKPSQKPTQSPTPGPTNKPTASPTGQMDQLVAHLKEVSPVSSDSLDNERSFSYRAMD